MQLRNTPSRYGGVAIVLHWLAAIAIVGLFALGYWMVDLTYYHDWYKRAPDIHRSIGLLLFGVMLLRVVWRLANPVPKPLPEHSRVEVLGAHAVHGLLYLLIFVDMVSGYLISTAGGDPISVFGWFDVPSVTGRVDRMEDLAGEVHYWATWALVILAGLHGVAALKHHMVDRDNTLRRMFGR